MCLSDEELRTVDPLVMNLVVAKGIPCFADLDIAHYVRLADEWADDIRRRLPAAEVHFRQNPAGWKNDIRFFRLGMVCWYVDEVLGITYPDELANAEDRLYADAMNIFLNGLMDRRRGSCASMPVLHVALGWRLGWPVSLACANDHLFCRYDDGEVTHNIEATTFGRGGFRSHPDDYYRQQYRIPEIAVSCDSDLRSDCPRDAGPVRRDSGLAFCIGAPDSRSGDGFASGQIPIPAESYLVRAQMEASIQCGLRLFDPGEIGYPTNVGRKLREHLLAAYWESSPTILTTEINHAKDLDTQRSPQTAARQ